MSADVFDRFLYQGERIIDLESLVAFDTTENAVPYGADQAPVPEQRCRDIAKLMTVKTDRGCCILAVENEGKFEGAITFAQRSGMIEMR